MAGSLEPTHEDSVLAAASVVAPAWAVALFGATVVLSGLAYFVWRVRRARRAGRSSLPPARRG